MRDVGFINAEWIRRYCDLEIKNECEDYDRDVRGLNDIFRNGEHMGKIRALRHLRGLIDTLESLCDEKLEQSKEG